MEDATYYVLTSDLTDKKQCFSGDCRHHERDTISLIMVCYA